MLRNSCPVIDGVSEDLDKAEWLHTDSNDNETVDSKVSPTAFLH